MVKDYTLQWLLKAANDLQVMRNESAVEAPRKVTEAVCFHAQQAVEKFLKGYLAEKNIEFGRTHNLQMLLKLCADTDSEFKALDMGNLTDYAVEVRYPDDFYSPTAAEAAEGARIAEAAAKFVLNKLQVSEKDLRNRPLPA